MSAFRVELYYKMQQRIIIIIDAGISLESLLYDMLSQTGSSTSIEAFPCRVDVNAKLRTTVDTSIRRSHHRHWGDRPNVDSG